MKHRLLYNQRSRLLVVSRENAAFTSLEQEVTAEQQVVIVGLFALGFVSQAQLPSPSDGAVSSLKICRHESRQNTTICILHCVGGGEGD